MPKKPPTTATPYARALARLARRDHSEQEIRRALRRDGFGDEAIDETVARLRRDRYLDDAGYAARLARSRLVHSGLGRNRVRQELLRKGVKRTVAEAGLSEALADVSEDQTVDALARRFWRSREKDEPRRRLQKLWAFLIRRGFPSSLVNERLHALWPRWSDALDGLEPVEE
ncbi:MAG TPA: regulatory protein RecX [Vicinamibacteria bacterium]|nr:regulatory protein RecX [Vicinamibacteria bacterium]